MRTLDAETLRRALPFQALVPALRQAFVAGCEVPLRHTHHIAGIGTALLMPAWRAGGRFGVKTVTIFPSNATRGLPAVHAVYALFDADTGVPLAVLDGSELTARRTAACAALAADFLAQQDATRLLVVGSGRVGALLPAALRSVRSGLAHVDVWNRSPGAAVDLANTLRSEGFDAHAVTALEPAVRDAHIVSCATLATAPLVHGAWLAPGAHLDLIGSFTPAMREADGACFALSRVFVDTDEALAKSGDILEAVRERAYDPAQTQGTLAQLCRGERAGRRDDTERTLFKSVGTALADLAAAELAFAFALADRRPIQHD